MNKFKHFDKFLHFVTGLVIFVVTGIMFGDFVAIMVTAAVAILKEARDLITGRGTPEFWDFNITVIGGIVGFLLLSQFQI